MTALIVALAIIRMYDTFVWAAKLLLNKNVVAAITVIALRISILKQQLFACASLTLLLHNKLKNTAKSLTHTHYGHGYCN